MSKSLGSYPWYLSDWRGSEARLMSCEARGIYRELLDHHYDQGSLPADESQLRKIASAEEKEWKRSWPAVKVHFFEQGGRLYNNKVVEKLPDLLRLAEARIEKARKANKARWGVDEDSLEQSPKKCLEQSSSDPRKMLEPSLTPTTALVIALAPESGGEHLQDSEPDPDPPKSTPPPKGPIRPFAKPAGNLQRVSIAEMPKPPDPKARAEIATTLRAFAPKLPDPAHDPKLLDSIQGAMQSAGWTCAEVAGILKPKRETLRNARSWGLIVEIVRTACRGKPQGPRKHPAGRILHPGDSGYDEAVPV